MRYLILALTVSSVLADGKLTYAEFAAHANDMFASQHHHDIALLVDQAFVKLDVHPKDGLLELEELANVFDLRDTDGDGKLTYAEFAAHANDNPLRHEIFNHFDTNKDGFLQKHELVYANFLAMDHNGDNQVSRHDFDHYYTNIIQHIQHHGR